MGTFGDSSTVGFANGAVSGAIQAALAGQHRAKASDESRHSIAERTNSAEIRQVARDATAEANDALNPIKGKVYPTRRAAAHAWSRAVRPVADKYDTEITSRFFNQGGGFVIGDAVSDGYRYSCDPLESAGPSDFSISAGYIHTHPGNALFSKNDLNTAVDMFTATNGRVYQAQFDQVVMVSLRNGDIFAWSAQSFNTSQGASYMNPKYYDEY